MLQHPDPAFPEPYLLTEARDALITNIMETMNGAKLTAHQAKALLPPSAIGGIGGTDWREDNALVRSLWT